LGRRSYPKLVKQLKADQQRYRAMMKSIRQSINNRSKRLQPNRTPPKRPIWKPPKKRQSRRRVEQSTSKRTVFVEIQTKIGTVITPADALLFKPRTIKVRNYGNSE